MIALVVFDVLGMLAAFCFDQRDQRITRTVGKHRLEM